MENQEQEQIKIMNVPNILSLLRMVLVPVFLASVLYMPRLTDSILLICLVPTVLFALTSLTDMLDGKIARKYHLITDFGKFIDPLADKFLVFGALTAVLASPTYTEIVPVFIWVTAVVMLRELGVTSLRLVVASKGIVVAASLLGKMKTVTQMLSLICILMEPAIPVLSADHILSYVCMALMTVTTIGSGIDYLKAFWPYLTGKK